jgi:hypothetical protein
MKPLDEYTTWQAIEADLRLKGLTEFDGYMIGKKELGTYYDWTDWVLGWDEEKDRFSCAIKEWGDFRIAYDYDHLYPWAIKRALLKYKPKFIRCSTTQRMSAELDQGLFDNGFIPTGQVKSNHGRYMVYMWEYWKE